ncbi:MAG: hypothetical protein QG657_3064 [Acidobacteriota bacterium]|nr:hypothetical protein [Acidobacteriota bacterium]
MGVKMKAMLILTVMVCLLCAAGFAQKKDPVEELAKRVESLEREKDFWKNNLAEQKGIIKEQFEIKSKNLDNQFTKLENDLKDDNSYLKILLWIFGSVTGVGLIFSFFKLRKQVEKIAEEKIREKFDQIFEEKKILIKAMIDKQDEEFQFKKEKKILVFTPGGSNNFLERFFDGEGFNKVEFAPPENFLKTDLEAFNLVLLDNEEGKFMKGLIPVIVRDSQEVVFVYFGPPTDDSRALQNEKNIAFANYGAQLYGNLINALRYQKYLKDR